MDTKWKNRKRTVSFLLFFLGVSLTLGSAADILREKPSGVRLWQLDRLLEDDYQETDRFRAYIASRLENFLIMATGGNGLGGIWGYNDGTYYGGGYDENYYYGNFYDGGFYDGGFYDRYGYRNFLTEDIPGNALNYAADGDTLPISGQELTEYLENLQNMQEEYLQMLEIMEEQADDPGQTENFLAELENYHNDMQNYIDDLAEYLPNRLSEEQIRPLTEEQKQEIAGKYHNQIKGDRNLLYTILYDGKVLYSNADLLPAAERSDGNMTASGDGSSAGCSAASGDGSSAGGSAAPGDGLSTAYGEISVPEGYNFLLYFDGKKVRILKDGRELDVYGDGYYREENDWYVPGYANFQTDDTVTKAAVCIAVAKEPVIYTEGTYENGSARQHDTPLYWMNVNVKSRQRLFLENFACLAAGLLLLLGSFLLRKSRREAMEGIARFQAKIWLECKIILFSALLYVLYMIYSTGASGYDLWEEFSIAWGFDYDYSSLSWFFRELAGTILSPFWILLFWGSWLLINDLRHNRKIWRCSLTAKLASTFSAKSLKQPLTRRMSRRNLAVFLLALLYGTLTLAGTVLVRAVWENKNARIGILLMTVIETVLFLALQYLAGVKNMNIARDMEILSRRITEIRNGNYTDASARTEDKTAAGPNESALPSGHDLDAVMAQLEDIRHGMANAVDEQMKSERMKVELIANVSHDIKTPLTSIISYVEFLKQEKELPEHVKDYIKILDEKSQRLKNMVTDVFAVSKAASGELPMQMEELDFGKLLLQTLADMEEQIQNSDVTFRTALPDEPVKILADGQRLYRVFQNLFQNAIQYSLKGSRVYVTLLTKGQLAEASVKNTSRLEPDKEKDFTERFTRGDESRTDGGSGLGLSIARSFTEACGGTFYWETDADLFVVKVIFSMH